MDQRDFDVLVIGAGISGISAAYYVQEMCPDRSFAILERRNTIGGTWDLFQYPGIRSDSDMYTLGFHFKPWEDPKAIAVGEDILQYIRETAEEFGLDKKIHYNRHVLRLDWSSDASRWTVNCVDDATGETFTYTANFVLSNCGYYDYDEGYQPEFEGKEDFKGTFVHPQKWPKDLDYENKKMVVIGSGATAVTLVPECAKKAEHVVMLQRSPTYMISMPWEDPIANFIKAILPTNWAYHIIRWKNVIVTQWLYWICTKFPERMKRVLIGRVKALLPPGYDVEKHFTPSYNPWQQRLCLVPAADLFKAIQDGKASVETDRINRFTEKGILLESGKELEADIIVSATGLNLLALGGMEIYKDAEKVDISNTVVYKGIMFSGIPNLAITVGYTNASWSLKCPIVGKFLSGLLNHMKAKNVSSCTPVNPPEESEQRPLLDNFTSGYIQRKIHLFPKQGSSSPWRSPQNYLFDYFTIPRSDFDDPVLQYENSTKKEV